jgi:adenylate cyclase
VQRQLAAILFADVAGYTRLMDFYEEDTHQRLMALFDDVVAPTVTAEAGRIVKSTGDGFLACFASVNSAVNAAASIQQEVRSREAAHPIERQIAFRMGLHSGDIVVEEHDIYGAGVNIAARLQELAEPGGLLISGAVREQLGANVGLPFVDLGYRELKNISNAVRVFAVGTANGDTPGPPRLLFGSPRGIPSIAVLPFVEYGAEPGESYFGDGLVEDIVAALATLPDFHVISRSSTLKYRGTQPDLRTVAGELGVRYILWGNVRRRHDRLRISAELADTETLRAIDSYQGEDAAAELFSLQDRLTERVVQRLAPNIRTAELGRIRRKRPENLDAYEYFLRGLDLLYRLDREEFDQARQMFREAIRLDPDYAPPYAFTALWHSACMMQGWSHDRAADRGSFQEFAAAALQRDPLNVYALALSGQLRALWLRDFDAAFDLLERALRASPSSAFAYARSSPIFSYIGDGTEARRRAVQSLRFSPFDPHVFFTHAVLGFAAYTEGNYDDAITWGRRSYAENPRFTATLRTLAASLAAAGHITEALQIGEVLLRLDPGFRVREFAQNYAYREQERRDRLEHHLMLAGLPE